PVFVAGFSRGASIAWGVACQDSDLSGIIALDGSFKQYREKPYDREAAVNKLRNSGEYAYILSRSRGWPGRQTLMRSVRQNPNGPALDGSNDTVGHQLSRTLHNAWGAGVLTNVLGGVSDITALATLMENYDRYYPAVQNIDNASIASVADDPSTPVDNGWGEIRMPVLYMGASRMGAEHLLDGIYSAGKSGSGDVTIYVLEDYGHLDVLVAENAQQDVYTPLLRWLLGRLPVRDPGVRPG
ncbi:MAG: hypothetical protein OEZ23_08065, partial [Gammaproteobacteria bacterium]|nr:hypothetical protein [Gammaproteobacteria bacterium]